MEKYIKGYKVFEPGLIANDGTKFEIGKPMHVDGEIKAGFQKGNGFHLCTHFEDALNYAKDPVLCEVIGYGNISEEYEDKNSEYYAILDIYACSDMVVTRIIPRNEIIEMAKKLYPERLKYFIMKYDMTDEEVEELLSVPQPEIIKQYIDYCHYGNKEAFNIKKKSIQ